MNLQQKTGPSAKTPWRQSACDDTPVSRGHRGTPPLRIVIADDHPVVLMGAEVALSSPGSTYSIIAQAHNADELIGHLEHTPCDLVISDYSMPYGRFSDGLVLMGYLKRHYAHLPLIVMTMLRNPSLLHALLGTGVNGLFDKRSPLIELKRAVSTVIKGRRHVCTTFSAILEARHLAGSNDGNAAVSLSDRELEVVRLFVQGLSGRQIAAQLNRSEKTISRQKRTAMDKLGLEHDGGLMEFARVSGLG